jgi:hypothetical protein
MSPAGISPERGFVGFLLLTVALLLVVVATGRRGRRRAHLATVVLTLASLGTTIAFAEAMGDHYDLAGAGWITPVHLWIAKGTTLAYLLPITTGILTWRDLRWRKRHQVCAYLVLALTALTAVTGTWMLLASERLSGPLPAAELPGEPGHQ